MNYRVTALWLLVIIFIVSLYFICQIYQDINKNYDKQYGIYNTCQECVKKGNSQYNCALKIAEDTNYYNQTSKELAEDGENLIEIRTESLIKKCSSKTSQELLQDLNLFISTKFPTIEDIRTACSNPEPTIRTYYENETIEAVCQVSDMKSYSGSIIERPGPIAVFFDAIYRFFGGILYGLLFLIPGVKT